MQSFREGFPDAVGDRQGTVGVGGLPSAASEDEPGQFANEELVSTAVPPHRLGAGVLWSGPATTVIRLAMSAGPSGANGSTGVAIRRSASPAIAAHSPARV